MLDLVGESGAFFWGCIEKMKAYKYWKILEISLRKAKEKYHTMQNRGNVFMSRAVIGGKLYSIHPKI